VKEGARGNSHPYLDRRHVITLLGGASAAWPLAARAQQGERMRRIGVLMNRADDDPEGQTRLAAFLQGLQEAGWAVGRNARVDIRWGVGEAGLFRAFASELIALAPDVILAAGTLSVAALQQTRSVPIVFAAIADPVAQGFVQSLARPGGNVTGFMNSEYSFSGKWLELLKEIAPRVTRVGVLRDAGNPTGIAQFSAIQALAPSLEAEVGPVNVRDASEIEHTVAAFARSANGGLIVTTTASATVHRDLIIALAARHKLPAVYGNRFAVARGGLISYGSDFTDEYRRAAFYVDRILKGEKPADLPVQAPTKYELVINLKTAKALGLEIPSSLLARADEVIE
jgi:putative tryptophan/tyrosine transport system substrate-binding protein